MAGGQVPPSAGAASPFKTWARQGSKWTDFVANMWAGYRGPIEEIKTDLERQAQTRPAEKRDESKEFNFPYA